MMHCDYEGKHLFQPQNRRHLKLWLCAVFFGMAIWFSSNTPPHIAQFLKPLMQPASQVDPLHSHPTVHRTVQYGAGNFVRWRPPHTRPSSAVPALSTALPHQPAPQPADFALEAVATANAVPIFLGVPGADASFEREMKEIARLKKRKEPRHKVLPPKSVFLDSLLMQINALSSQNTTAEKIEPFDTSPLAPSHLSDEFIVYLTAFLINFDSDFTKWWTTGLKYQMPYSIRPKYRGSRAIRIRLVRKDFQEMARQLRRKCTKVPVEQLAKLLDAYYRHGKPNSPESRQLALLLAMLPKEGQAVVQDTIKTVWGTETGFRRTASHVPLRPDSNIVMLRGAGFYGPKMLSQSVRPVFDESTGAWMVPDPHMLAKSNRHPFTAADLHSEIPTVSPSFWWGIVLLGMSGALSCMLTNTLVFPLDVLKTAQQTSEVSLSLLEAAREVVAARGGLGLFYGFGAMMMNEFCLGLIMYPGVELGKIWLSAKVGAELAKSYRAFIVILATCMATVVSCLAQSPWEAAKIRIQAVPGYASTCFGVVHRMLAEHGLHSLYAGYVPLLCRMVFYNSAKFIVFDYFLDLVFRVVPSLSAPALHHLMLLVKGFVAGLFATFVSQPADAMLTRMTQSDEITDLWGAAASILEHKGIVGFFSGFLVRCLWSAAKIALQFFCYDRIKATFYDAVLFGVN